MDSFFQFFQLLFGGNPLGLDVVLFGDFGAWVGPAVGQCAVVGQKHQSFGIEIKTSHRKDPLGDFFEVIENGGASFRIAGGHHHVFRFVKKIIDPFLLDLDRTVIDRNFIGLRIDLGAELRDHMAVHLDPALGDPFFGLAPRREPRLGNDFLQPHCFIQIHANSLIFHIFSDVYQDF